MSELDKIPISEEISDMHSLVRCEDINASEGITIHVELQDDISFVSIVH